ncbi:hypothetical protein EX895_001852 [Sporisorium graminicola]|uniref:Zn(2)-C6 fungal-type domain-containing protein n=1 Tax=Sporisorium graminicola TaxID=280036 RepID=A0A4U7KX41_9BASI|nr:hypothetical protein EX895_001852 [Sporisorium graminicola]TKY89321.1 hypothetical protein EX895_001852 [Sporisorium graminicola]
MQPKPIAAQPEPTSTSFGASETGSPSSSVSPRARSPSGTATPDRSFANGNGSVSSSLSKAAAAGASAGPSRPATAALAAKIAASRQHGTVADAVAASLGSKRERKRKRIHYSCAECHRRKHKCDRQTPCQPCIDRGLGDSCRPFEDGDQFGDMRDRVQRLEDIVEGLAIAHAELAKELKDSRGQMAAFVEMVSSDEEQDADPNDSAAAMRPKPKKRRRIIRPSTARGIEREELFNSEAQAIAASKGEVIDSTNSKANVPRYDLGGNPLEGGLARDGDSWFGALALPSVSRGVIETEINGERLELGANFPRFPASVKLHRLIHEGGAPENILSDLMNSLPSKADTDRLLDIYFRDINHTRLPIHEGTFRQSYDELMEFRWGNAKEERGDDGARHVPFLAFLFAILATAMRSLPEALGSETEAKKGAVRLYHACRRTINIASTIRVDHIDLVLAHLFAARFLICQRQSAESWSLLGNAIRAAQAIGLHRDGSKLGLDAITTERRRRLWAIIFYMDKTTSILLGRPQAIQEFHCDTLPPSDIDIDTMPRSARPYVPRTRPRPNTPPGVFLFVAIRHELTRLTGKIVEHFQNLASPRRYADVVALDEELEKFRKDIPDIYRVDKAATGTGPDTNKEFDAVCPWLPLHRYLLNIEYHYVRIALHRPYVLRNSEKYSHSRKAGFESAKADRRVRQEYRKDVKWEPERARKVHMGGLYRLFNATMMIGIALLLDPNGPEAPDFLSYLDEFIELHKHREGEADQCSKREVKIIELFRAKARDPTWCATSATGAGKKLVEGSSKGKGGQADASAGLSKGSARSKDAAGKRESSKEGTAGVGTAAFSSAMLLGGAKPSSSQLARASSVNTTDSITPPPFAGLFSSSAGAAAPGLALGTVSTGTTSDAATDLAQSIFDQLGGYEPSFGMLNPTPNDALNFNSGSGLGFGPSHTSNSMGFDSAAGFDITSYFNTPPPGSSGPSPNVTANAATSSAPGLGRSSSSTNSINIPATSSEHSGIPNFQPSAHPHLRALNTPGGINGFPGSSGGGEGGARAGDVSGLNGAGGLNSAGAGGGAPSDWGLLPWGGLIEAIAQSSHGIDQQQQHGSNGTPSSHSELKTETPDGSDKH